MFVYNPPVSSEESGGGPICLYKTADTTRNNDSTPSADPELITTELEANSVYAFRAVMISTAHATPDMKWGFYIDGVGCDLNWSQDLDNAAASSYGNDNYFLVAGYGSARIGHAAGEFSTGESVTSFACRWSQYTADANNTTLNKGSYILIWKLN